MTEEKLGKRVLQTGLEILTEEVVRSGLLSGNSINWATAILDTVEEEEGIALQLNRVVSDPVQALESAKRAVVEGGYKKVREISKDWSIGDLHAVLRLIVPAE